MLERIAKYIKNYDTYSFTDAYESIDECVQDLATYTPSEMLEVLEDMDDGTTEFRQMIDDYMASMGYEVCPTEMILNL